MFERWARGLSCCTKFLTPAVPTAIDHEESEGKQIMRGEGYWNVIRLQIWCVPFLVRVFSRVPKHVNSCTPNRDLWIMCHDHKVHTDIKYCLVRSEHVCRSLIFWVRSKIYLLSLTGSTQCVAHAVHGGCLPRLTVTAAKQQSPQQHKHARKRKWKGALWGEPLVY